MTSSSEPASLADLFRLKRFLVVAEMGSLTKAAVVLDTTQSALSLQMAALERDCGQRLFDRTGRGVALTELGNRLAPRARDLLRSAELLTQEIRAAAGVPVGEVVVGLLPSIASALVSVLLREVLRDLPNVRLRILEGSNGQIDEWLSAGRLDVAVLYRYGKALAPHEESLCTIDSWLVGPKGDAVTRSGTVPFKKLHQLPLVLPGMPNGLRAAMNQQAQRLRVELKVAVEVDSIPTQKDLAQGGFGYAVLGRHAVTAELAAGSLQAARIVQPGIARAVTLATSSQNPETLASKAVTATIRRLVIQTMAQAG
jgi:DNA-binding transcriptional LysR family regulator